MLIETKEREGGERMREISVREMLIGCLPMFTLRGSNQQPRHVPWPGIESAAFWCPPTN